MALVAALYFGGHFQRTNAFLHEQGCLPRGSAPVASAGASIAAPTY